MNSEKTLEPKNCGESCGCADAKTSPKPEPQKTEAKKEPELDPTHFGDWQINCRAIDF